jgi:hypothetical protein
LKTKEELKEKNIIRKGAGCSCGISLGTYRYTLPFKLDDKIIPFLSSFGGPCVNFNQIGFLRIENAEYCISGLKNNYHVSFLQKKPCEATLDSFEEALILYVVG